MRACLTCRQEKPLADFAETGFAYAGKPRARRNVCRVCVNAGKREARRCIDCGRKILVRNAVFITMRGKQYARRSCKPCWARRQQEADARRREAHILYKRRQRRTWAA